VGAHCARRTGCGEHGVRRSSGYGKPKTFIRLSIPSGSEESAVRRKMQILARRMTKYEMRGEARHHLATDCYTPLAAGSQMQLLDLEAEP